MTEIRARSRRFDMVALAIVLAFGIFLRIPAETFSPGEPLHSIAALHPQPGFNHVGFDEALYRQYVNNLIDHGITVYPEIVEDYVDRQSELPTAILPPVRFLYIFAGYVWHSLFGCEALQALKAVSALFSVFTLALAAVFAWRFRGAMCSVAIAALMATAPTQIHMSQHALIDGFFAFWALLTLWMLWENLQAPYNWRWLAGYTASLSLLVLTKENSFLVWIAIVALLIANRWMQFGTVTRELLVATALGPFLGVVVLIFLAGGIDVLFATYRLLIDKAYQLPYAIHTGDGPWYRYLVDLLLVSPIILILALGTIFRLNRTMKPELFMSIFIAASYLVMCNVKYGMNLRYANMWDLPLRFLALSQIVAFASLAKNYRGAIIAGAVVLLAAIEFHQYIVLAVRYPLYELITHDLLQALQILKSP